MKTNQQKNQRQRPHSARAHPRSSPVPQTSKSAVSRVSKPADRGTRRTRWNFPSPADLEIGATAGLETCATAAARQRSRSAFTLIELLLVLVILGILAAIVVPKFAGRTEQARVTAAQTQLASFGTALDAFEVDTGSYPKGKGGLIDLIQQPRDAQNWRGPYLKDKGEVPLDPWGNAYIYECPGKHNPSGYDLMSMGPDGRVGGDDDISNWGNKR